MEITLYAVFLVLIIVLFLGRFRDVKRRSEGYYLRSYFEIFEYPIDQRAERILAWEREAYNYAYPQKVIKNTELLNSDKVVSIHKFI
jgi:hypothetical protein